MNADHSHNTEVPDHECHRNVVHGNVIRLKNLTEEKKKKKGEDYGLHLLKTMETSHRCNLQIFLLFFYILLLNVVTQM